jgi:hypothetical protein
LVIDHCATTKNLAIEEVVTENYGDEKVYGD